jgi:hypothetical protein
MKRILAENPGSASLRYLKKQKRTGHAPVPGTFLDWLDKKAALPKRPTHPRWAVVVVRRIVRATRRDRRSPAAVRATADSGGDLDPEPPRSSCSLPMPGGAL